MGQFSDRIQQLEDEIGTGTLEGVVEVDQVYAKWQHEDLSLKHPGGGKAKFLEGPLLEHYPAYFQRLADSLLDGQLTDAMINNVESLSREVYAHAPIEFGDLKASGHPMVNDAGELVYDRAPMIHRLSEDEIDIKKHLRELGLGNVKAEDGFGGVG